MRVYAKPGWWSVSVIAGILVVAAPACDLLGIVAPPDGYRRGDSLATDEILSDDVQQRLQDHAAACERCRGSRDLIQLAGQPAAKRDPLPLPDEDRFASIHAGVRQQILNNRIHRGRTVFVAAAAVLLIGWLGLAVRSRLEPAEQLPAVTASEIRYEDLWGQDDWSEEVWAGAGVVPDTTDLDEEEQAALWKWLEDGGEV